MMDDQKILWENREDHIEIEISASTGQSIIILLLQHEKREKKIHTPFENFKAVSCLLGVLLSRVC